MSDVKNTTLKVEKLQTEHKIQAQLRSNSLDIKLDRSLLFENGYPSIEPLKLSQSKTLLRTERLSKKTGYYIVPVNGFFYYYKIPPPIKRNDHLYDFSPSGKTIREGFVVIDKELIYVTLEDIERRIIRTSRIVKTKKTSVTYDDFVNNTFRTAAVSKPVATPSDIGGSTRAKISDPLFDFSVENPNGTKDENLGGTVEGIELAEQQAIDLVIKEQERALFDSLSEEEGFHYEIA